MSYEPKLAAALSGATLAQLAHWRNARDGQGAILLPELSATKPVLYSFRDILALRTCVALRRESSLQRIRKALSTLRVDLGERDHLSRYTLVAGNDTIYFVDVDEQEAVDLVRSRANLVMHELVEVLRPYYYNGRRVPALFEPRPHLSVRPDVRGGEPVIKGTRVPYQQVASLVRDGVAAARIRDFYPGVSEAAAVDAADFADYADSYQTQVAA
ncbi:hypothetical protein Cme02nite_45300 [Catellatospora methionotrophica]|uniref:DUF433 domain-containing protein n=1 Tax=Catellatospora methionotrophica TaxID=121620 RepID=A0A8J3LDG7_9ACTN|nr:DUF433 domain-containing protein [Catellatospora methionotrophica]GIG16198.1 hypothetical protein Cme02nite_45300 [Catellatospora methionotrophica]